MLNNILNNEYTVPVLITLLIICIIIIIVMSYFLIKPKTILSKEQILSDNIEKNNLDTIKETTLQNSKNNNSRNPMIKGTDTVKNEKVKINKDIKRISTNEIDNNRKRKNDQVILHEEGRKVLIKDSVLGGKTESFNPFYSKPEKLDYTNLSIVDGALVESAAGKASYYRFWKYENRLFFEFFCEESRLLKTINNHSVTIDPFCQKSDDSKSHIEAESISTVKFGELDSNLRIVSKPIIKYN